MKQQAEGKKCRKVYRHERIIFLVQMRNEIYQHYRLFMSMLRGNTALISSLPIDERTFSILDKLCVDKVS
jgi:hypothetical protein